MANERHQERCWNSKKVMYKMEWSTIIAIAIVLCIIMIVVSFVMLTWGFWSGLGDTLGLAEAFPHVSKIFGGG